MPNNIRNMWEEAAKGETAPSKPKPPALTPEQLKDELIKKSAAAHAAQVAKHLANGTYES